jgi:hypothetical protein
VAGALGVLLGIPIYLFLGIFGLFSLIAAIFVGPAVGGLVAEAVRRSVGRRRGRYQKYIAAGAWIAGLILAGAFLAVLGVLAPLRIFRLDVLLAAVLAVSAITARLW